MRAAPPLALLLAALCTACAAPGPYPSLEPREVERRYADGDPEPVPTPVADDAAIAVRIAGLVAQARAGDAAFEEALAVASPLVARAGAPGSDSWVAAQQAVSRAERARAPTVQALADLDAYAIAQAAAKALSQSDLERLSSATAALQAMADRQQDALARLQASLRRP